MKKNTSPVLTVLLVLLAGISIGLAVVAFGSLQRNIRLERENAELKRTVSSMQQAESEASESISESAEESISTQPFTGTAADTETGTAQEEQTAAPAVTAETLSAIEAGRVFTAEEIGDNIDSYYAVYEITEGDAVYNRIINKSYRVNDNIALSDLRYLKMLHFNFENQYQMGEMIVNAAIADDVINIFRELCHNSYPIQSMYLVDNYWAGDGDSTDYASIEANNTSAFCYRTATNSSSLSNHAYGRAIDLNPLINPYVRVRSDGSYSSPHEGSQQYLDRSNESRLVIKKGDECESLFARYGFGWGGDWSNPIDFQHFEKPAA